MASVDRLVWSASLDLSCMYGGQVSSAGKPGGQKSSVGPNNMFSIYQGRMVQHLWKDFRSNVLNVFLVVVKPSAFVDERPSSCYFFKSK